MGTSVVTEQHERLIVIIIEFRFCNFMTSVKLVLCFVFAAYCSALATNLPVPWPEKFSIKFVSNITTSVSAPVLPIYNTMYYDSSIKLQRVDHGAGSYECVNFYFSDLPCTIWFTPDGLYRQLNAPLPPSQPDCCLDMPDIKASAPNWAAQTDPLPTFLGIDNDVYSGMKTNHWAFLAYDPSSQKGYHEYRQVTGDNNGLNGRPLVFTFPVQDGMQDYHFDPNSMIFEQPDSNLFTLPVSCRKSDGTPNLCPQSARK